MSTGFIARWSLRKRTAARRISTDSATARQSERGPPVEQENSAPSPRAPEPTSAADSATTSAANADPIAKIAAAGNLPALDSITAETDIRAFLAAGVPQDLARPALRRAVGAPAIIYASACCYAANTDKAGSTAARRSCRQAHSWARFAAVSGTASHGRKLLTLAAPGRYWSPLNNNKNAPPMRDSGL